MPTDSLRVVFTLDTCSFDAETTSVSEYGIYGGALLLSASASTSSCQYRTLPGAPGRYTENHLKYAVTLQKYTENHLKYAVSVNENRDFGGFPGIAPFPHYEVLKRRKDQCLMADTSSDPNESSTPGYGSSSPSDHSSASNPAEEDEEECTCAAAVADQLRAERSL